MTIARKVLSNTMYQLIGRISMATIAVCILKLITNYLGVAGYGDYVTIYEYLGFFAIFADMGIYTIAIKEMSKNKEKMSTVFGSIMALRSTMAFLLMFIAAIAAFFIPQYQGSRIPIGIAIASVTTFFTMLQTTACAVLQVKYKMQYSTIAMILGKLVSLIYIVLIIFVFFPKTGISTANASITSIFISTNSRFILNSFPLEAGFWHLIFGGVLSGIIMYFFTNYFVNRYMRYKYIFDLDYWVQVLKTSIPYGLALILNNIYFKIDVLLISLILPKDIASIQTGIYGVAMRLLEMLVIIPVYFMNSVLPIMIQYLKENNKKLNQLIQYSFDFLSSASMPILAGIGVLSAEIIDLISTKSFVSNYSFYGSDTATKILMFALVLSFMNSLFGFIIVAIEKQTKLLLINSVCVIFNIVTNTIFIPVFGFIGASVTSVFSELFILVFTYITVKKYINIQISIIPFIKFMVSAIIMGVSVFLLKPFFTGKTWLLLIPIGGLIYGVFVFVTKAVDKELKDMILLKK